MIHKAGFVNIVGNPNVGKSTLMNQLVGERISIATFKAQTTRHRIMGIVNEDDCQIVFSDTPGVLKPNYKMQEMMLAFSESALTDADILLYVTDVVENPEKNVPVAVLAGTMIAGVCYMTSTAIIGGLVPHTELVSAGAPFGLAYAAMFGNTVGHMVSAMLVVSCFVSLTAWQFTISEVVREAATIGHFPSYLRKVNRFYAPYMAIGTLVCIQSIMTLSTISPTLLKQFNVLINLAVMVNLIPYLLAMASVPDLQKAEGISAKNAKLPNMAAIIGGIYSVYAVYGCGWDIILYGTLVTVFGIVIYMLKTARLSPAGFQTYPPKK